MRTLRWLTAGILAGIPLALASPAGADGGAYFQLDRTYYPAGATAHAETYVAVPERLQGVFDRGPFFAYLLPADEWLTEGRRLPSEAVRVGTVAISSAGRDAFELGVSFTVPELDSGNYNLQLCNDPCTVSGFREPLSGLITVAGTQAEAGLLAERDRLVWHVAGLRHQLGKLKRANLELETELQAASLERDAVRADLAELRAGPAASPSTAISAADARRPILDPWALIAVAGGLLVAAVSVALGIVFSRRHAVRGVVTGSV